MSRPLWGKGNRASGGRGGLALINRLLHSQRTHPNDCRSKKQRQIRRAIQSRKRAPPLRHPNGCHLSPKGEAKLFTVKHVQNPKAVPLGAPKGTSFASEVAGVSLMEGGNLLAT